MIRTILGSRGGGSIPGHEVIKGKVENKHLGWISSSGSLHVLPVSNGGSELFLTYLSPSSEGVRNYPCIFERFSEGTFFPDFGFLQFLFLIDFFQVIKCRCVS